VTAAFAEARFGREASEPEIKQALAQAVAAELKNHEGRFDPLAGPRPNVVLFVGVNGSGKTTTLGKIAADLRRRGAKVMVVAGDTFRAAAVDQLKVWADRSGATFVSGKPEADPAGLAFDALTRARAEGFDVVLIDTAGRLQNKQALMDELLKIIRVIRKVDPEAPHEVLLVLDATVGRNALAQEQVFGRMAMVSGIVMTKLDGTARGGVLVPVAHASDAPIKLIGVGEGIDDLQPFNAAGLRPLAGRDRRSGAGGMTPLREKPSPWVRLGVDFGAPGAFLIAYFVSRDILTATWALVAGSAVALALGWVIEKRVAPLPLVAGFAAIVFGGLTLFFHDDFWVKVKPTALNLCFSGFLLGGVLTRRSPLKAILGEVVRLPDPMWRTLAIRYGIYFLLVAGLNEAVWRTQPEEVWVLFRMPGLQLLSLAFSATQFPLMMRGAKAMEAADAEEAGRVRGAGES
jgi:fused signal recognition particle receptor